MTGVKKKSKNTLIADDFVHLHNHTHHSLLDGLTKVGELVDTVKNMGMSSVAMTDHGTLSGAIEFYKACKAKGVKPLLGIETYVAARTIRDRDPAVDKARYHLILIAMNGVGYQNLMRLSSIANLEGMYYKPRVDHQLLEEYSEGLIVLSACIGGEVGEALRNDDYQKAKKVAGWYKSVFGDRYYLELQDHEDWDEQKKVNDQIIKLGKDLNIDCVLTSDAHYLKESDQEAHEILLCVGTSAFLSDQSRMSLKQFHLHVTDPKDIIKRWGERDPEVILNTGEIAKRCQVELDLDKMLIPTFPTPKNENEKSYLDKLVWRGLARRFIVTEGDGMDRVPEDKIKEKLSKELVDRTTYELSVIDSMGFNGYFLIVQDFINWGKDQGIIFGPGRGSAAGSLVAYALRITELDPIKYNLMFERFLNPSRISMPDIDIDIQDSRRDEVIQYCVEKYGKDRVANICTFGTMAARAAVRDVARVLQVPYGDADRLAKLIPQPVQGRHILLSKSIVKDPDLKNEYDNNKVAKEVIDYAIRLEGTIRSHGVHAAGVVIAPDDIVKFSPLEMSPKGVVATQYSMGPIEEIGLLKMDFLGLSNLTIINNAMRIIAKVYGKNIILGEIDMDDQKTFDLLRRADTTGVFQLESAGMKRYLKELGPTEFADIIAMVALYRPGPMAEIPRFISGKNDPNSVKYLHKSLEPILGETYGVMVFQEQIINLLQLIAGYTAGEADLVRKAIGKKKREIMMAEEPKFIEGCLRQGLTRQNAEKLWALIQPFADYSFNKAHAACYAMVAYWTAYLKANYPDAFMAALMTSDQDDMDRLGIEISECRHMGITVLAPDVNQSYVEFAIVPDKNQIRFGMAAVKGVGTSAVEEIIRCRDEDGKFINIGDFAKRVSTSKFNKRAWESLIKSGAFDTMGDRSTLLFNIDTITGYASRLQKDTRSNQSDLFADMGDAISLPALVLQDAPLIHHEREKLKWERDLLGLYLSAHPLDRYDKYFEEQTVPLDSITEEHDKKNVTIGGLVSSLRTILTKNGSKMAFIQIEDKSGSGEVIVFPKILESYSDEFDKDIVLKITGKVSTTAKDGKPLGEVKIIAESITIVSNEELDSYKTTGKKMPHLKRGHSPKKSLNEELVISQRKNNISKSIEEAELKIYVRVDDPTDHKSLLKLKKTFNNFPGTSEIILVLGTDNSSAIRLPFRANASKELREELSALYGEKAVVYK